MRQIIPPHLLIIPTYNRNKKLRKTLRTYAALKVSTPIIILDGSDEEFAMVNQQIVKKIEGHLNIEYRSIKKTSLLDRLIGFFASVDPNTLVCLGNDEDVFLPEYMEKAAVFLTENPDYTVYIGRYLTWQKRMLGLNRISSWRETFIRTDINYESPEARLYMLQRIMISGCPPVFYGMRRAVHYHDSLVLLKSIYIESTEELADQVYCALKGNMKFDDVIMVWRDELVLKLDERPNRNDPENMIPLDGREEFLRALSGFQHFHDNAFSNAFLDWYFLKCDPQSRFSFNMWLHKKSYSRIDNKDGQKLIAILIGMEKVFKIFSEIAYNFVWDFIFIKKGLFRAALIFKR